MFLEWVKMIFFFLGRRPAGLSSREAFWDGSLWSRMTSQEGTLTPIKEICHDLFRFLDQSEWDHTRFWPDSHGEEKNFYDHGHSHPEKTLVTKVNIMNGWPSYFYFPDGKCSMWEVLIQVALDIPQVFFLKGKHGGVFILLAYFIPSGLLQEKTFVPGVSLKRMVVYLDVVCLTA